jgi:accessory gene regulator protein AgrB
MTCSLIFLDTVDPNVIHTYTHIISLNRYVRVKIITLNPLTMNVSAKKYKNIQTYDKMYDAEMIKPEHSII